MVLVRRVGQKTLPSSLLHAQCISLRLAGQAQCPMIAPSTSSSLAVCVCLSMLHLICLCRVVLGWCSSGYMLLWCSNMQLIFSNTSRYTLWHRLWENFKAITWADLHTPAGNGQPKTLTANLLICRTYITGMDSPILHSSSLCHESWVVSSGYLVYIML